MRVVFVVVAAVLLSINPLSAKPKRGALISGAVGVVDGDTIAIGSARIRLHGIDALEAAQVCRRDDGREWHCGREATSYMEQLVRGQQIDCAVVTRDRFRRLVATCWVGRVDVGEAMVRAGYALACRKYSTAYVEAEADARRGRRGLWSGSFEAPWVYRKRRRQERWAQRGTARSH